jgi:solute:Na+ symporter, SSS family
MHLALTDWLIVGAFFLISLAIGLYASRQAGKSSSEFFLSGRNMPWWLLGISMVATTFAADTPTLVTDIVRKNGVSGNWQWWAFLLTGMLTVFVYARLWRRSGIATDLEFYELRYGGKPAAFLRGFRALYLGVFFNIMIMATVSLAAIKIGEILLNLAPWQTLVIASLVTVAYSSLGGLRGVILTDFVQFIVAMAGSLGAAWYLLSRPEIGSLPQLLSDVRVSEKLSLLPDFSDSSTLVPFLVIPLAVQWWSVWYPGAEPGGGGYIAQRMLASKSEKHALGATLFFNIAHYALRPWPWIIVALCSLVMFPDLESLKLAFPHAEKIDDDLAYPAMLTYLPVGLLGLVVASLIAAYMSTISTHLNWGASYVVNDFYKRFVKPEAGEKELVRVGRLTTVGLMAISALFALALSNALQAFNLLLQVGAGTGLIFILRWFWWRINAYSEITGMVVSFLLAIYFELVHEALGFAPLSGSEKLLAGVGLTTVAWLVATFLTSPEKDEVLMRFYSTIRPAALGWKPMLRKHPEIKVEQGRLPMEIGLMVVGCFTVYSTLFATGYWIYGNTDFALLATGIAVVGGVVLTRGIRRI